MKIAILVDSLVNKGGVERIVLSHAKYFNADIYTTKYNSKTTFEEFKNCKINKLTKLSLPQRLHHIYSRILFKRLRLKKYDLFILHGGAALGAAKNNHPNIWHCYAPSRWIYDLYLDELKKLKIIKKNLFIIMTYFLRKEDQKNVNFIDSIIAISRFTKERVKKYYNRDSTIIYPFVDLKKFKFNKLSDFYLCAGRVDSIKRQYLAVEAFKRMPKKKLIIAGGGPDLNKIKELAKGFSNIKILGEVSEKKLQELYSNCLAVIYLSYKEDFGIVPLEAMASGKPGIATDDGGFKETIINKKTGLLINPTKVDNIISAINWLTKDKVESMRENCEKRAKLFSEEEHIKKISELIKNIL